MTTEQAQFQPPPAQVEHRWLQRLVGTWTFENEPGPGAPMDSGIETVRALGELWILCQAESNAGHRYVLTLGFDPEKERIVGTFVSSMMTYLWPYDGELDASRKMLTLYSEGPGMAPGAPHARYMEQFEMVSDDHRVFRSSIMGDDGAWQQFQVTHYRRQS